MSIGPNLASRIGRGRVLPTTPRVLYDVNLAGLSTISFSDLCNYRQFRSLRLIGMGRGSAAATSVSVPLTFNDDTGTNYANERHYGNGASSLAANALADASIYLADMVADTGIANIASTFDLQIFDFANETFQKITHGKYTLQHTSSAAGTFNFQTAGYWHNISPINKLTVGLSSGTWKVGSRLTLVGLPW